MYYPAPSRLRPRPAGAPRRRVIAKAGLTQRANRQMPEDDDLRGEVASVNDGKAASTGSN